MKHLLSRIPACTLLGVALALCTNVRTAEAHPHVFVEGGVSFVLDDEGALAALEVTWRYDLFETLYALSSLEIVPELDGTLSDTDRQRVSDYMTDWPEAFEGSAHLSVAGEGLSLSRPTSMDVELDDGNLLMRFRRDLDQAVPIQASSAEVAFYEATYFYAFTATEPPEVVGGDGEACTAGIVPYNSDEQLETLQVTLFALGREETPDVPNVGALFADRIVLRCE